MATITHSVVSAAPNDPTKEVSSDAWNAGHTLTGLVAADISNSSAVGRSVLTAADAAAARTAIGAGTSSFGGAYSSLSGIPSTFTPAAHVHSGADITSGTVAVARLGSGTPNATNYLRGDGTWVTPAGGSDPWTYVKLGSDFTTSSATAVDVTGLAFTPSANLTYEFEALLFLRTATATVNPRPGLAWPTGLTDGGVLIAQSQLAAGAQVYAAGNPNAAVLAPVGGIPNATQSWPAKIHGAIIVGAAPSGTIKIQLASETALTNVTVKAGSFLKYRTI